jgi:hypothetical protein
MRAHVGFLVGAVLLVASWWTAPAVAAPVLPDAMVTYIARDGDTLIGIGDRLLIRPGDWVALQRLNQINNPRAIPIGTPIRIPVSWVRTTEAPASVLSVSGSATADGRSVAAGDPVRPGTTLQTTTGAVTVALADGSQLILQPQSRATVSRTHTAPALGVFENVIDLLFGRVEALVNPVRRNDRFEIKSTTASLGVRGTQFRVSTDAEGKVTTSEVIKGAIGATGKLSSAPPVAVEAGFGVRVERGQEPLPPVRLLPAPNVTALPARLERVLIRLTIPEVVGAKQFRGQIARDSAFQEIAAETLSVAGELRFGDLPDGQYYLRVRAIDAQGIEGQDAVHRFTLKARPEPPFLSEPQARGKVIAGEVSLLWSQPVGIQRFRLQVARDAGFRDVVIDNNDVTAPSAKVGLTTPGDYFWRVGSITSAGDPGPYSDALMFTVRPLAAALPAPTVSSDRLTFSLQAEPQQKLEFQVARDIEFRDLVATSIHASGTISLPSPGTGEYFIRYRTLDADGFAAPYSAPQKVTLQGTPWYLLLFLLPLLL